MLNPDSQVWNPGASWQIPHPLQPLHVRNNKLGAQISKFGQLLPFQIQLDPVQFVKFAKQAPQPWPLDQNVRKIRITNYNFLLINRANIRRRSWTVLVRVLVRVLELVLVKALACLSFFGLSRKIRCCNCPIQLRISGSSLFAASESTLDKAFGLIYWDQVRQNFQFQVRLISSR